jgi:Cu2+-exporting ATPase
MDAPVSLGIAAAFAASAWATISGEGDVYFDSITMFVFLLLGARYVEAQARAGAGRSLRQLVKRTPAVAERLVEAGLPGAIERVAVSRLTPGDRIVVAPGSTIAADGTVVEGRSAADESLLTGEARPVAKAVGDAVIGGSTNLSSPLTIAVTHVGPGTVLAGIVRLMDRAQAARPRIAQLADRVAQWFVLALFAIAAVTGAYWMSVDPERALWVTIAVLVVSCPCALSVATPAALAAATGAMHRAGMLIVRGHAMETLPRVTHVVLDKTGTLTAGRMSLVDVERLGAESAKRCFAIAAALERGSEHAIARALRAACPSPDLVVDELVNHPGRGIEGRIGDAVVRLGSPAFVAALTRLPLPQALDSARERTTCVLLGDDRRYYALFTLADALRPGAGALVSGLQAQGMKVCLLSGDRRETVVQLARTLGVDDAVGEAAAEAKLAYVRDLQGSGACVAMIGDGINDAPVLAQAQVSIAMGNGTDLAQAAADIVLVGDDLSRLPEAFHLARRTMRVIRQNLLWALVYNLLTIPFAALGWITPLIAGAGMAGSSLVVVLNALRLQSPLPAADRPPKASSRALVPAGPAGA